MKKIGQFGLIMMMLAASWSWAQTKVATPVFPEGYEQWPNVFHRHLDLGNQKQFNFTVWVKEYSEKSSEMLFVEEINGAPIFVWHLRTKDQESYDRIYLFMKDGYSRIGGPENVPSVFSEDLLKQSAVAIQERFGLDDAAAQKIGNFLDLYGEDLDKFLDKVKSKKP